MANRMFTAVLQSMEKLPVSLYAKCTFGATGAITLSAPNSKGILSVTKNGTGLYTFVFGTSASSLDSYYKLLAVDHVFDTSGTSAAPAAPGAYITSNLVATSGSCSITLQFDAAGTPTNPASGEIVYINFVLSNSSAY